MLPTCAVARKSEVGEKERLVATVGVRKASTSWPVGMSNVRMTESWEVVMTHRESGEKACAIVVSSRSLWRRRRTHEIQNLAAKSREHSHDALGFDVDDANGEIVAGRSEKAVLALEENGGNASRSDDRLAELHRLEVEELHRTHPHQLTPKTPERKERTWTPPLSVDTMTTRFSASVAIPVTCFPFVSPAPPLGTLKIFLLSPLWRLYMTTSPAADPTSP